MTSDMMTVPCRLCGTSTQMRATKLCDNCWELDRRISLANVEVVERILAALKPPHKSERSGQLERALVSLMGLFDPYGNGRLVEPEIECQDRLARAQDVLDADEGNKPDSEQEAPCRRCGGAGDLEASDTTRGPYGETFTVGCPTCNGTGVVPSA